MDIETKINLNNVIDQIASNPHRSPQQTELLLFEILHPLLEEEGYAVQTEVQGLIGSVDLIANQGSYNMAVECKSGQLSLSRVQRAIDQLTQYSQDFERLLLVCDSDINERIRNMTAASAPHLVELYDLEGLREWLSGIDVTNEEVSTHMLGIVRTMSLQMAQAVAADINSLQGMEWRQLEQMMATVFDELGFDVELTPCSRDGGKDLILTCRVENESKTFYIELKHWRSRSKVGNKIVTDFIQVIINDDVDGGILWSSSGFNNNAFEGLTTIERSKFNTGKAEEISNICSYYVRVNNGVFAPPEDLSELIFQPGRIGI